MILTILSASQTASEAKTQAGTNSPEKEGGVFLDQYGNEYEYEPGKNWYAEHEETVKAGEKDALLELKTTGGYQASLRKPKSVGGAMPEPPAEWDHLVVTTTREETELLKGHEQEVMDALVEALHNMPEGRRMLAISYAHDDTGNLHWHINLHRFAVDHENKSISNSKDLTKNSIAHQTRERINEVMREKGLLELSDFVARDGRALGADRGMPPEAHAATKQVIQDAGGVDITEPKTSLVRGIVSPDLMRIAQAETTARKEVAQIEQEIHRLRELSQVKATTLVDIQSAKAALAERDQAIQDKQEAEAVRDAAIAERDAAEERANKAEEVQGDLTGKVLNLTGQIDELQMRVEDFETQVEEQNETIAELNTKLNDVNVLVQTTNEALENAVAVSETWERAAKEEITAHGETSAERDLLKEQVVSLEDELKAQTDRFARELEEQNHAAKAQMESLRQQFELQAQQAERFIGALTTQNETAQRQIEHLTSQMQQQSERFTQQLTEQADRFTSQIEKAMAGATGKTTKRDKTADHKPEAEKEKTKAKDKDAKASDDKGKGIDKNQATRDAINAAIKQAVNKRKEPGNENEADDDLERDD